MRSYPVRRTSRSKLQEVDFKFENEMLRDLEQNPNTGSYWAELGQLGTPRGSAGEHRSVFVANLPPKLLPAKTPQP